MKNPIKKTFILATMLSMVSAFAEPTDNDPVTSIDPGSVVTVLKSINIPVEYAGKYGDPAMTYYQHGKRVPTVADVTDEPGCNLAIRYKDGSDYFRDVEIPKGSRLVLIKVEAIRPYGYLDFKLRDGSVLTLSCFPSNSKRERVPTIGQFKEAMAGAFALKLAPPMIIQ